MRAICTICSNNYLHHARVLGASLEKTNPELKRYLLIVDKPEATVDLSLIGWEVIFLQDLPKLDFLNYMLFRYDQLEANTAVKPHFLRTLLTDYGVTQLVYVDPDIAFFGSLNSVWQTLEENDAALTPHITKPYDDFFWPSDLQISRAGVYNLGFLGLSKTSEVMLFLEWWQEKLREHCYMNVEKGVHVDQKWMEFAPSFLPRCAILRDPRLNIAYWNLHYRGEHLSVEDTTLFYDEAPAVFFHFSGFERDKSESISKHQDRYQLSDWDALRPLFSWYKTELEANEAKNYSALPYGYDKFNSGAQIPALARTIYRDLGPAAVRFGNPFDVEEKNSFFTFLNRSTRVARGRRLTRLQAAIYQSRPDLKKAFPDFSSDDFTRFKRWLLLWGRYEHRLSDVFVENIDPMVLRERDESQPVRRMRHAILERMGMWHAPAPKDTPAGEPIAAASKDFGANIVGFSRGGFGVGEAARSTLRGLQAAQVSTERYSLRQRPSDYGIERDDKHLPTTAYPTTIWHVNADILPFAVASLYPRLHQGRTNIGVFYWELENFPRNWSNSFEYLNQVWVASDFCKAAIEPVSPVPVTQVDFPVVIEPTPGGRQRFGIDKEAFLVLFSFDFRSEFARKNPLAVVEVFRRVLGNDPRALLVIKSMNGDYNPRGWSELDHALKGLGAMHIPEKIGTSDYQALLSAADVYMSLHHSEGFGFGMAQSMALGIPVIATNYSGNTEFMTANNSFPVGYSLTELRHQYGPYTRGSIWADPDLDEAAEALHIVRYDTALAQSRAERGRADMLARYSPAVAGEKMRALLMEADSAHYAEVPRRSNSTHL